MKKTSLTLFVAPFLVAAPVFAADYLVVVPVKGRTAAAPVDAITVSLNAYTLPGALEGSVYSFDLKPLLQVTGDKAYTGAGVMWSEVSSTLPSGLYLTADGYIGGTPTATGTGNITVRATYKAKSGEQTYQVVSAALTVGLASAALPEGTVGQAFSYDFKPLASSNDPAFTGAQASFSATGLPAGLSLAANGLLAGTPSWDSVDTSIDVTVNYKNALSSRSYLLPIKIVLADPVWNPDTFGGTGSASYLNGNRRATFTAGLNGVAPTVPLPTYGKWYWETEYHAGSSSYSGVGTLPISSHVGNGTYGQTYSCGVDMNATVSGLMAASVGAWKSGVSTTPASPIIGHAYDATSRTVSFYRGGVYLGQCGVYGTQTLYARVGNSASAQGGTSYTLKMHPSQQTYPPPSGYRAGVPQP